MHAHRLSLIASVALLTACAGGDGERGDDTTFTTTTPTTGEGSVSRTAGGRERPGASPRRAMARGAWGRAHWPLSWQPQISMRRCQSQSEFKLVPWRWTSQ